MRQTFGSDPQTVAKVVDMLMQSWPVMTNYQQPLGLAFLDVDSANTHFGPWPWNNSARRPDWGDVYFNRADTEGLGFDRTSKGRYDTVAQYNSPLKETFDDLAATPEDHLLWFHHVSWDYRTKSGRTLWEELQYRYQQGVAGVETLQKTWDGLKGRIDEERHTAVKQYLVMQHRDAVWFQDASLAYFETFARRPFANGYKPKYDLDTYKKLPPNTAPPE